MKLCQIINRPACASRYFPYIIVVQFDNNFIQQTMHEYVMLFNSDLYLDEKKSFESVIESLVFWHPLWMIHSITTHITSFSDKQSFVKLKWIHLLWFSFEIKLVWNAWHDFYLCVITTTDGIRNVRKRTSAQVLFHLKLLLVSFFWIKIRFSSWTFSPFFELNFKWIHCQSKVIWIAF